MTERMPPCGVTGLSPSARPVVPAPAGASIPCAAQRDRPILFSAPMVRALLDGRKTQTRRVLTPQPYPFTCEGRSNWNASGCVGGRISTSDEDLLSLHRWRQGDLLWVKEAHYLTDDGDEEFAVYAADEDATRQHLAEIDSLPASFPAEVKRRHRRLRPSIHMPRWASRLTLLVTDVRVERLDDISDEDAKAEGVEPIIDHGVGNTHLHITPFFRLWDRLHGPLASLFNPWVAAVTFQVVNANIADAASAGDAAAAAETLGSAEGEHATLAEGDAR